MNSLELLTTCRHIEGLADKWLLSQPRTTSSIPVRLVWRLFHSPSAVVTIKAIGPPIEPLIDAKSVTGPVAESFIHEVVVVRTP